MKKLNLRNKGQYIPKIPIMRIRTTSYKPPYEEYEDKKTVPAVANAASTRVQPEYTQVPPASNTKKVVVNKVSSTTQPQVL